MAGVRAVATEAVAALAAPPQVPDRRTDPHSPRTKPQTMPRAPHHRPRGLARMPATPVMHPPRAKATPHGAGGGAAEAAAALQAAPQTQAPQDPPPRSGECYPVGGSPLQQIGDPIDRHVVTRGLRWPSRVRAAYGAQPADAEVAGGIEHRQAVIDE